MTTKSERLNIRLTASQDEVLRRAADVRGVPVSDYVLRHAVEAAEMDLADQRVFVLEDAAWNQLQALLDKPPAMPPRVAKLLSNPTVLESP